MYLSSTYPSSYCRTIGLEKPLSDSLWNDIFDLGNRLMLKHQVAALELVLALHERAIERHRQIDLSSPYPSKYCIIIGLGKPLSDSLWNDSFDLGNRLMLKLQVAALIELVLALHERAIEQHRRMYLSTTYLSRYCILIGLEKPLSDSLWNDNLALGRIG
jgi:hypothetical protein